MSKKKNTLKDLDEFLRQQAAVIVPPSSLNEKLFESEESPAQTQHEQTTPPSVHDVTVESVIAQLNALSKKEGGRFRHKLYDIVIRTLEETNQATPEDKMLINTALYLKSGDNWKDAIREYWRRKIR